MSPGFTPGPWEFDGYPEGQVYEVSGNERIVCCCEFELEGDDRTWPRMAESRANARLIAAAPTMYEAAEEFLSAWTEADNADREARAAIALGKALAKARGEVA